MHVTPTLGHDLSLQGPLKNERQQLHKKHEIAEEEPASVSVALFTKIWPGVSPCCSPSLIPYGIVTHIVEACLTDFLQSASRDLALGGHDVTSCVRTAFAVSEVFLGAQKTELMLSRLRHGGSRASMEYFSPSGKRCVFRINGLFDGIWVSEMNKDHTIDVSALKKSDIYDLTKFHSREFMVKLHKVVTSTAKSTLSTLTEEEFIQECKRGIVLKNYFARKVISLLRAEIAQNQEQVGTNKSFLYCIAGLFVIDSQRMFDHACVLEQFFCEERGYPRFRLYQSCIREATLGQALQNMAYSEGESSFGHDGMARFLDNLEGLYCKKTVSYKTCFGYGHIATTKYPVFAADELIGPSLRYFSSAFVPAETLQHLDAFLQNHEQLKKYFY